jgi:hypothetical protein
MTTSGYDSPTAVPGTEDLKELALDMRWSWDHGADELWNQIEPELWDLTRNPWVALQTAAPTKLKELCRDPRFSEKASMLTRVALVRVAQAEIIAQLPDARPANDYTPPPDPPPPRRNCPVGGGADPVATVTRMQLLHTRVGAGRNQARSY